jgi:hypothetical protein
MVVYTAYPTIIIIKLLQHVMITILCTSFHVQQIRIFIFAVGPGRNNDLERIACDNGGIGACRKVCYSIYQIVVPQAGYMKLEATMTS